MWIQQAAHHEHEKHTYSTPVRQTCFLFTEQCSTKSRGHILPSRLMVLYPILLQHLILRALGSVVEHDSSSLGMYAWLLKSSSHGMQNFQHLRFQHQMTS